MTKKDCKISIIGAGSAVFSMNLIKDICVNEHFKHCTVSLMDINEDRLNAIYGLCKRYTEEMGGEIVVEKTMDRRESMKDADFVLNVALDYGHERFKEGIKIAYENGYRFGGSLHLVHDEGFYINFYQLRLMESILQDVLEICPNAYYIMVANPVQAGVTYLQRKYKNAKVIGMCHGFGGVFTLAKALGLDPKKVSYEIAGVNHFIWLTSFRYEGQDAYPLIDKWIESDEYKEYCKNLEISSLVGPKAVDLYKRYGLFPIGDTSNPGGGSWGWEYHSDDETEKKFIEDPYNWYVDYFKECDRKVAQIRDVVENLDAKVSDTFSTMASNEPMIPLMEGLAYDTKTTVIVNILNDGGYMKGLPTDYEVEIAAICDKDGIHPIHNNGLPKPIMSHLVRDRIASVEMELEAYDTHSREKLVDLIMMDPHTRSRSQAEKVIDDILNMPCNWEMKEYYK